MTIVLPSLWSENRWETTIIKWYYILRHAFLQWEEHIACSLCYTNMMNVMSWPGCWSELDKGPSCLRCDYTRCFNNTVYTCADVPKHRLYYCTHTNRYTDTETCCAHLLDGSPTSIKMSLCTGLWTISPAPNSFECGFFFFFFFNVYFVLSFVNWWKHQQVWPPREAYMRNS